MKWLKQLSRNLGLMVYNVKHPSSPAGPEASRQEINRTVEEQQLDSTTTLRRTTIEEIEIRQSASKQTDPQHDGATRPS